MIQEAHSPSKEDTDSDGSGIGNLEGQMERIPERRQKVRTIEEKKEILGTMLGNVDALVSSVTKAGIWGLG